MGGTGAAKRTPVFPAFASTCSICRSIRANRVFCSIVSALSELLGSGARVCVWDRQEACSGVGTALVRADNRGVETRIDP